MLTPIGVEEMSHNPLIVIYYNITTTAEMDSLKALATLQVENIIQSLSTWESKGRIL